MKAPRPRHSRSLPPPRIVPLLLFLLAACLPDMARAAIVSDPNCARNVLPRTDDGWVSTPLGFPMILGDAVHTDVFVDNNGYVAFGIPPPNNVGDPQQRLEAPGYTAIAAYYSDIDSRNAASDEVTYGQTLYAGHRAFCINWGSVNGVGYYAFRADKRNKFQLILVHREDRGTYDFDIIMNYDQIQWDMTHTDLGDASRRGTWVGFTGNSRAIPGAGVIPSGLLDGQSRALTSGSRGTPVPGRYIYEIHNGRSPAVAVVSGTLYQPENQPIAGASAQFCREDGKCVGVLSDAQGRYKVSIQEGLVNGTPFTLSANPPSGPALLPLQEAFRVTPVVGAVLEGYDAFFKAPSYFPPDTRLEPLRAVSPANVPVVYWGDPLHLSTTGCPGGTATYTIYAGPDDTGPVVAQGPMTDILQNAHYEADVPPLQPAHGLATIVMRIHCPNGTVLVRDFNVYIDPSGFVRNANGNPIRGALMTLYRSDYAQGPFELVPDGSSIMSPANRTNPMYSDARGYFGWDTLAGYYVVRAERAGCTAVGRAAQPYTETDVLPVPPPVTDLDLRLDCGAVPPPVLFVPSSMVVEAQNAAGAVVTYAASASDAADGAVAVKCLPASGSFFPFGTTGVQCSAMNSYGNVATTNFSVTVADTQPPVLVLPEALSAYATTVAGASVTYAASAADALDGALTPVCAPPSGATFLPGVSLARCEASDSHGNTAEGTFPVHVMYEFGGVLPPLSRSSTFKNNQVIPVRFALTGASAGISTLEARLFVAKSVNGEVGQEVPAVSAGGSATGNLFRPTATGTYQFLLSANTLTPGVYRLRLDLGDAALHELFITLTD